ncbi:hypothetical protein G4B88_009332 [Cannabis sativa]|uniref:Transposase Tnp1/En/Spm-like domain-containing protein n=1 Tax=Cannabis sativa TaxID=3483 RepID=A0A7J6FSY9_CANSA|nr:hypothetical protein G4B88_009332 [Cannabis sativa]
MWRIIQHFRSLVKKRSATNKTSRGKKKYNHTTGTKSFAQIKSAEVTLQELEEINRDISKEKSMNDTYSEIMGKKRYGSIRIYGFGVCPSDVWENKSSKKRNQSKYIKALESEQKELRSKVQNDNAKRACTITRNLNANSSKKVGGKELGDFYSEVIVQVPIKCDEQLIRAYGKFKTIDEVVGVPIAWPTIFLIS